MDPEIFGEVEIGSAIVGHETQEWEVSDVLHRGEREHGVDRLPVYEQRAAWFLTPAFALLLASLFLGEGRRTRVV